MPVAAPRGLRSDVVASDAPALREERRQSTKSDLLIPVIFDRRPSPPAPRATARARAKASGSRAAREGKESIPDPDGRSSSRSGIRDHRD